MSKQNKKNITKGAWPGRTFLPVTIVTTDKSDNLQPQRSKRTTNRWRHRSVPRTTDGAVCYFTYVTALARNFFPVMASRTVAHGQLNDTQYFSDDGGIQVKAKN